MELREVAKDKFNAIANKFICKNFFQTSNMGDSLESRGKKIYYLGLANKEEWVALAMLMEDGTFLSKKIFLYACIYLCDDYSVRVVISFYVSG